MKAIGLKVILIIAIVLALPMIIPGPDGKPIMSFEDWLPSDLISGLGRAAAKLENAVEGDGNTETVYGWVDEHGVQHYSGAPSAAAKAEPLRLPENENIIPPPASSSLVEAARASRSGGSDDVSLKELEALVDGDYSKAPELLKNLPELLEQAKQARQTQRTID